MALDITQNPALLQVPRINAEPPESLSRHDRQAFRTNRMSAWNSLAAAAFNHAVAAQDILNAQPTQAANPWVARAVSYLRYFRTILRSYYVDYQNNCPIDTFKRVIVNSLNTINAVAMMFIDIDDDTAFDNINLIWRHDLVELVVQTVWHGAPAPPTTLVQLETLLQQTQLYQQHSRIRITNRNRRNASLWDCGLPMVVAVRLGRAGALGAPADDVRVACSKAKWGSLARIETVTTAWRLARFADVTWMHDIQAAGNFVCATFNQNRSMKRPFDAARDNNAAAVRQRDQPRIQQSWNELNIILGRMWDANRVRAQARPDLYAFDHSAEIFASFFASRGKIFSPIGRCFKCRYVHLFEVNEPRFDNAATVEFAVYPPLACAEDLLHYLCSLPMGAATTVGVNRNPLVLPPNTLPTLLHWLGLSMLHGFPTVDLQAR